MGQLPVVRRIIAILTALLFVSAGATADLHIFGYAMAALSVMVALPLVYPSRSA